MWRDLLGHNTARPEIGGGGGETQKKQLSGLLSFVA